MMDEMVPCSVTDNSRFMKMKRAQLLHDAPLNYFVIAVRTGQEGKYLSAFRRLHGDIDGRLIWPRRSLTIRKAGVKKERIASLFPGYLFWETRELTDREFSAFRKVPGFIKFLKSNQEILPLDRRDREAFLTLIADGEILRQSTAVFDENRRIRVIGGPLVRLEGNIIRVDRRKGRARVRLSFYGRTMNADLGFEVLELIPEWNQPASMIRSRAAAGHSIGAGASL